MPMNKNRHNEKSCVLIVDANQTCYKDLLKTVFGLRLWTEIEGFILELEFLLHHLKTGHSSDAQQVSLSVFHKHLQPSLFYNIKLKQSTRIKLSQYLNKTFKNVIKALIAGGR